MEGSSMIAVIVFTQHEPEPGTRANKQWNELWAPNGDENVYVAMMLDYAMLDSRAQRRSQGEFLSFSLCERKTGYTKE
jgi:hypothetical protein